MTSLYQRTFDRDDVATVIAALTVLLLITKNLGPVMILVGMLPPGDQHVFQSALALLGMDHSPANFHEPQRPDVELAMKSCARASTLLRELSEWFEVGATA